MVISSNYTGLPDCQRNSLVVFGCTAAVYVFGITLLLLIRFVKCRWVLKNSDEDSLHKLIRSRQLRWFPKQAEALLTGKTIAGKLLIFVRSVLYCLCSAIYLFNTYSSQQLCIPVDHRPQFILELSSNFVFLLIFILKVIASKNLLNTWLSMDCIIDHCTIIPCILAFVFGFYQYGFGFLYFTRVVKAMEFLLLLKIVDRERSMRKLKIISNLLAAWLTLAGVFLLLERIGNFWQWRGSQQNLDYFDCVYFLLVTVATVGYGDIVCTSYLGRLVTIIVIIGALISITTHVSELYELFFTTKRYCGTFNNEYHPRHVLVCGAINHKSVSRFLDAFVRADLSRFDENIMTVFLST
ncbi:unnamed protein product [Dicrocoelium dendriticum]|nr:unnamed protein product [Dicrocoelium dendriticum]